MSSEKASLGAGRRGSREKDVSAGLEQGFETAKKVLTITIGGLRCSRHLRQRV